MSRELMTSTLNFTHQGRIPRQCWQLPVIELTYPEETAELGRKFSDDMVKAPSFLKTPQQVTGDAFKVGIDALNSQIFCMGVDKLEQFAGQITFWGEIDRQHMLIEATHEELSAAVEKVYNKLYRNEGVIAQCDFGPGVTPDRVETVFAFWNKMNQ